MYAAIKGANLRRNLKTFSSLFTVTVPVWNGISEDNDSVPFRDMTAMCQVGVHPGQAPHPAILGIQHRHLSPI